MPSLLQNMMGLSEVARATQTPDLSIQHRHSPRLPPCHGVNLAAGFKEGQSKHGPSASRGWAGGAAWGFGQDSSAPAASAQAPSTGQLFSHHSGVVAASLCSAWDLGAQSHIPRPVATLSRPFAVSTSGKAALYTPTASCLHPHPAPRWGLSSPGG